jgi:hypothetical protein
MGELCEFYSFINEERYKIQGRKKFAENDEVKLGYFSGSEPLI